MSDMSMNLNGMEYDKSSTMFDPEGHIIQVEYANKTVRQGSTALGIVYRSGVILLYERKTQSKLQIPLPLEKVMPVDTHVQVAMAGLISDGRMLIENAQESAQDYRLTYDSPIDIMTLAKHVSKIKQSYTQFTGLRPFGVSLMFAGIDDKPRLYVTEPSGVLFEYKAAVIGEGYMAADLLRDEYKDNLTRDAAVSLGLKALKEVMKQSFSESNIFGVCMDTKDMIFEEISRETIEGAIGG